jgi:hypothetical protein
MLTILPVQQEHRGRSRGSLAKCLSVDVQNIADRRLIVVGEGLVRFRYKDYAAGGTTKVTELRAGSCENLL